MTWSCSDSCTISRRTDVHRWPAVPTAAKAVARTASSRSALGVMMMALLPPSSRIVRPSRRPTTSATRRPMRQLPVAETRGSRPSATMVSPISAASPRHRLKTPSHPLARATSSDDFLHRNRAQRCQRRWLPDHRIAADRRDHGVPRPDCHREVEGRDDSDRPQRVPLLEHPVVWALAGDREAVKLARQPDGEIAHVDHFLNFAFAFAPDLAGLDGDQQPEIGLSARRASPS